MPNTLNNKTHSMCRQLKYFLFLGLICGLISNPFSKLMAQDQESDQEGTSVALLCVSESRICDLMPTSVKNELEDIGEALQGQYIPALAKGFHNTHAISNIGLIPYYGVSKFELFHIGHNSQCFSPSG